MTDAPDFEGINIMIRRKGLGLSQAELADMLDTNRSPHAARPPHNSHPVRRVRSTILNPCRRACQRR